MYALNAGAFFGLPAVFYLMRHQTESKGMYVIQFDNVVPAGASYGRGWLCTLA